jgi:glycosyltransferase involved in cell wall biosynthesis
MKILFIGMPNSIHTARWISQFNAQTDCSVFLYPSQPSRLLSDFKNITYFHPNIFHIKNVDKSIKSRFLFPPIFSNPLLKKASILIFPDLEAKSLARVIRAIQPDVVHSLGIQHAGYLTFKARGLLGKNFPTWVVSTWGSDLYFFGRLEEHIPRIKEVLSSCDYYYPESNRDKKLAFEMGFKGITLPATPATGGFDLEEISKHRQSGPTSDRKIILLKGRQGSLGRPLFALRAIELCANELGGFEIVIIQATEDVKLASRLLVQKTGLNIRIQPFSPTNEILDLFGKARISIGLSISDGLSSFLLESMMLGTFPIHSDNGCESEWVKNGKTAILVDPEDLKAIEKAIQKAVSNDSFVNQAAKINEQVAKKRLNCNLIEPSVMKSYNNMVLKKTQENDDHLINKSERIVNS